MKGGREWQVWRALPAKIGYSAFFADLLKTL